MDNKRNIRIDYSKYEVDEVAETIADAILFPIYIGRVLISVMLFFLILIGVLAYLVTNHFILGFFFYLFSFLITLPSILLISGVRLLNTIKDDINKVFKICIDTTEYIYNDSQMLLEQRKSGLPISTTFKDIFRGVAIYVIRPSLKKVLKKRIKFMASPFVFLVDQLFKILVINKQPEFNIIEDQSEHIKIEQSSGSINAKIRGGGSKVTNVTLGAVSVPVYIALFIYGSVNLLIVWLLSLLF
jgi:hypothetical protein